MNVEELTEHLKQKGYSLREKTDRPCIVVDAFDLLETMTSLKAGALALDMLCDHTAIDWVAEGKIELVYQLYSTQLNHSLMVVAKVDRKEPLAPSVSRVWKIAEWQEREIYDLFGVKYTGHPDLRRLFLEDDWKGHPLLKDYKDDFMLERPW